MQKKNMKAFTALIPFLTVLCLASVFANAQEQGDTRGKTKKSDAGVLCESEGDMPDDLDFADQIVACSQEAVILYDLSTSKKNREPAQEMFSSAQRGGTSRGESGKHAHNDGAHFIIRAHYTLESPSLAINSLYQQMSSVCAKGWELDRQWSKTAEKEYYLHYEFTCSDEEGR